MAMQWLIERDGKVYFSPDVNLSIMQSIGNLLQIGDREFYGSNAFHNVQTDLFKREYTFKATIINILTTIINRFEDRVSITSMDLERVNSETYKLFINLITLQGQELSFSLDVKGF